MIEPDCSGRRAQNYLALGQGQIGRLGVGGCARFAATGFGQSGTDSIYGRKFNDKLFGRQVPKGWQKETPSERWLRSVT